jgi:hypothetical protein
VTPDDVGRRVPNVCPACGQSSAFTVFRYKSPTEKMSVRIRCAGCKAPVYDGPIEDDEPDSIPRGSGGG